jgi:chromate transport protein ChrA
VTSKVQQNENRRDKASSEKEMRTGSFGQTVLEPFLVFLRLCLTSFGGPIAHLGYFRQEFVERRKWLTEQTFADLVALCNFLPGPTSSQVCYSIGMTRGGIPGGISAWIAFTLPSAIIMLLAAYGIHWVSGEQGAGWLHGLKVVAVAVVTQAVWSMATKLCTDRTRITFAFVAAVIILLTNSSWVQVLTITLGALAGWKLIRAEAPPERSEMFTRLPNRAQSISSLAAFGFAFWSCLFLPPVNRTDGCRYLTVSIARDRSFSAVATLFSHFYRRKLCRRAGRTTIPSWPDMASLRLCQVHCFLLRPISGRLRAVLPPVGWPDYGVFSRFFFHPCFW